MTTSFMNMFLVTTAITVVAALLALTLRSGPTVRRSDGPAPGRCRRSAGMTRIDPAASWPTGCGSSAGYLRMVTPLKPM
jgi:hypothetical protein